MRYNYWQYMYVFYFQPPLKKYWILSWLIFNKNTPNIFKTSISLKYPYQF